mmetsp:Transcript_8399/g.15257  ORF Transcript_8399/g.15257 Transcript_8399/m.15257 type:complete len:201 (+) Transcript_8399:729-1331(+)
MSALPFPVLSGSMALTMFVSMVLVLSEGLRMIGGALPILASGEPDFKQGSERDLKDTSGLLSSRPWKCVSFPFLLLLFLELPSSSSSSSSYFFSATKDVDDGGGGIGSCGELPREPPELSSFTTFSSFSFDGGPLRPKVAKGLPYWMSGGSAIKFKPILLPPDCASASFFSPPHMPFNSGLVFLALLSSFADRRSASPSS